MAGPYLVRMPLGTVRVTLDRNGIGLGERGGFEAAWTDIADDPLSAEAFRQIVKTHLAEVYRLETGTEPPGVALNLASHQLMDDLEGWAKLNYQEVGG